MKYLKIVTILIPVLATGVAAYAQDIITTVKAEKVKAEITEIDTEIIRYRQYDDQDGRVYNIKKSDIASITSQRGEIAIFEQLQEDSKDTIYKSKATDYEYFRGLGDRSMAEFLEINDVESYQIFHRGEILKKQGIKVLIAGGAITGVGIASFMASYLIPFGAVFYSLLSFKPAPEWVFNLQWLTIAGLSAIIAGQPLFIAGIALQASGGTLKRKAKNSYKDKFFKSRTTMLNFNVYPNGLGVTFKF